MKGVCNFLRASSSFPPIPHVNNETLPYLCTRKKSLLFNHGFVFAGAFMEGMAKAFEAPEMLVVGRGLVGLNCGRQKKKLIKCKNS